VWTEVVAIFGDMPVETTTAFIGSNGTTGVEVLDSAVGIIDVRVVLTAGLSSRVVSASDYGVRGSRFESRR